MRNCISQVRKPQCELHIFCILTTAESRAIYGASKMHLSPPYTHTVASATIHSKALVLLLFIHFFACADPVSFVKGSNFDGFFQLMRGGRIQIHHKRTIIDPSKWLFAGVLMMAQH